jgi:hypothetical protein
MGTLTTRVVITYTIIRQKSYTYAGNDKDFIAQSYTYYLLQSLQSQTATKSVCSLPVNKKR